MWKRDINGIEEKQNKETKRIYQQIGTNVFDFFTEKVIQMGFCSLRSSTDGFAEQNGRDAERADLLY